MHRVTTTLEGVIAVPDSLPRARSAQVVAGMPRRGRRNVLLATAVGIPASIVLMYLAIRGADLGNVWRTLQQVKPLPLLAATACMGVVYWLQAARWRRIAMTGAGQLQFLEMVVAGVAVNNVLPGRLGDLLRARWVSRGAFSYGRGIATVVFDRGTTLLGARSQDQDLPATPAGAVGDKSGLWVIRGTPDSERRCPPIGGRERERTRPFGPGQLSPEAGREVP